MEDSPNLEVQALFDCGALQDGLGCGGEGGVGPTLVWYRLGAGAAVEETTAAAGEAAVSSAAAGGAALEPPEGGGEKRRTRGRKALPPWVFAILDPEKEEKGVGEGGGGN